VQGSNKSVAQMIVEADTPMEVKNNGAFKVFTQEYERADTNVMRSYTDAYYVKFAPQISGKVTPLRPTWRNYQATVLAFAKSDNDPTNPDIRRGSDSILVTFRDWITPWINLEYLDDAELSPLILDTRNKFASKVTTNYQDTSRFMKSEVGRMVTNDGLIGKMRSYRVIDQALDGLTVANPPEFLPGLTQAVQQGVQVQHTLENAQATALGTSGGAVAFDAITESITRADVDVSGVNNQISTLQSQVTQVKAQFDTVNGTVASMQTSLGTLSGKVDSTLAESGLLGSLRADVNTVKGQLATFQLLNPTDVTTNIGQVKNLMSSVDSLTKRVDAIQIGNR
jgi:hypothetical protein